MTNHPLSDRALDTWKQLYDCADAIAALAPWEKFQSGDTFACVLKAQKTTFFFSFLQTGSGQRSLACYLGHRQYCEARQRLTAPNSKNEPVFYLQNALIGLWGDREQLLAADRRVLKALGLSFRGRGAWPTFHVYRPGCLPAPLTEQQAALLLAGLTPLHTMVEAVVNQKQAVAFDRDEVLLWSDDQPDRFFRSSKAALALTAPLTYRPYRCPEDESIPALKALPSRLYAVEMDWGYWDFVMRNGQKKFYPRFLLAVDSASSYIYSAKLTSPYEDYYAFPLDTLRLLIAEYGKPKKLFLSDPELEACLADFCEKIDLPLTMKKSLPQTTWARKVFWEKLFGAQGEES